MAKQQYIPGISDLDLIQERLVKLVEGKYNRNWETDIREFLDHRIYPILLACRRAEVQKVGSRGHFLSLEDRMIESDNSLMNCVLPCIIKATLPDRETSGYILNVYLNAGKIDLAFDRRDASLFNKVSAKLILENVKLLEAGYQLVSEEVY